MVLSVIYIKEVCHAFPKAGKCVPFVQTSCSGTFWACSYPFHLVPPFLSNPADLSWIIEQNKCPKRPVSHLRGAVLMEGPVTVISPTLHHRHDPYILYHRIGQNRMNNALIDIHKPLGQLFGFYRNSFFE